MKPDLRTVLKLEKVVKVHEKEDSKTNLESCAGTLASESACGSGKPSIGAGTGSKDLDSYTSAACELAMQPDFSNNSDQAFQDKLVRLRGEGDINLGFVYARAKKEHTYCHQQAS